ncbi:MAG: PA domain-containing protein, partial [Candidatus Bathyarchaeia archaeon]
MVNFYDCDRDIIEATYLSKDLFRNLVVLCDEIGVRWSGTPGEERARDFLKGKLIEYGLEDVHEERFEFMGWYPRESTLELTPPVATLGAVESIPMIYSPSAEVEGKLVYVGHGTPRDFEVKEKEIRGNVVLTTNAAFPPFTGVMVPIEEKYRRCVELGASGMIAMNERNMGGLCFTGLVKWFSKKDGEYYPNDELGEIPCISVSKETGERLKRELSKGNRGLKASVSTETSFKRVSSWIVVGELRGEKRPDEDVLLCAHYDGMFLSPAAVDNASGTCVLLGVTEALSKLKK